MNKWGKLMDRIMGRIEVVECGYDTPCWLWQGSTSGDGRGGGYGTISVAGVTAKVHRVMYTRYHGFIPPGKQIDHLCNQRSCCNPEHLEMVSQSENMKRVHRRKKND